MNKLKEFGMSLVPDILITLLSYFGKGLAFLGFVEKPKVERKKKNIGDLIKNRMDAEMTKEEVAGECTQFANEFGTGHDVGRSYVDPDGYINIEDFFVDNIYISPEDISIKKVDTIKAVREVTGVDLKEAKIMVDEYIAYLEDKGDVAA